jgi:hypothetical protein
VGVTEERFRIFPRGGGKSQLDGMFAKSKCYMPFESVCALLITNYSLFPQWAK